MAWTAPLLTSIAVRSLEEAITHFSEKFGFERLGPIVDGRLGFGLRWCNMGFNGAPFFELIEPTTPDSPIAKFIERRGEGVFQVRLGVRNMGDHCRQLEKAGIQVIRSDAEDALAQELAWIHPRSAYGVLFELKEDCSQQANEDG